MPPWNPVYNMTPTTAPGLMGLPYTVGGIIAPMIGGVAHPYVPANQSIADAYAAQRLVDPNYKNFLQNAYGQLGFQIANTVGGMGFVDSLAGMTGYDAGQMRRDISGFGRAFGRNIVGSLVMPALDQILASSGVTGGSFLGSLNAIYSNRMALMSPGVFANPYDAMQQRASVGAASAMMQLVNGLVSKTAASGAMTAGVDVNFTKGFSREQVAGLAMRMAGAGMFSGASGGFAAELGAASGLDDLGALDWSHGDFKHLGVNHDNPGSIIGARTDQASKINRFTRVFTNRMKAGIEAMGAMRDLLHEVDGLEDKLTALTGGEWLRSGTGAMRARDAVNRLNAVSKAYNLDPQSAVERIGMSGYTLQAASLGSAQAADTMRALGFDGGGMFRIAAQTELLAGIEDMVSRRGVRGDPVLAGRLREQGVQAAARNMNTRAGVATQVLAWARQRGALTQSQYDAFATGIESGDQSVMGDSINRMLTTVFGSSRRGRELLQDQMFVQRMRQDMDDQAGQDAMRLMMSGAEREFVNRESMTAADRRVGFASSVLADAGMSTVQTRAGVEATVSSVASSLAEVDETAAAAFREQYGARVAGGASPASALRAVMAAFRDSPATAKHAQRMELAAKQQRAANGEDAYIAGGRDSGQATAMMKFLRRSGAITGSQASEIAKLVRSGNGAGALALAERYGSALSSAQAELLSRVRGDAGERYDAAVATIEDNREAAGLVKTAARFGIGSDALGQMWGAATSAISDYRRSDMADTDMDLFRAALEKSGISRLYGEEGKEAFAKYVDELVNATPEALDAEIKARGRRGVVLAQLASEQLKGYGYGFGMSGYFGGTGWGVKGYGAAIDAREAAVRKIQGVIEDADLEYGGDRQTLAQDLVDWAHGGKSLKNVLKVYDGGSKMYELFKDNGVVAAREEWDRGKKALGKVSADIDNMLHAFRRRGGASGNAADRIEALLGKAASMTGEEFEASLDRIGAASADGAYRGLAPTERDNLVAAAAAYRQIAEASASMDAGLENIAKDRKTADVYKAHKANMEYAKGRASSRYADALAFIADDGVAERLGAAHADSGGSLKGLGALGRAYGAARKAVSDDDVAKRLGYGDWASMREVGVSGDRIAAARLSILKERYGAGDGDAIRAMDKFRVAARQDKAVPVKGTLIIKSGRDQGTGVLEGDFGGM